MTGFYPNYLAVVLTLLLAVIACGCTAAGGEDDRISGNGTVMYVDLEGGFYGIVADDGERYLPADLPVEFRQDGLRVAFTADRATGAATLQQWGTPVDIVSIKEGDTCRMIATNGTVAYIDLEGGFYGIVTDDGEHYLPLDLDEALAVDGMNVTFVARARDDVATIGEWGTPVEIIAIDRIGNATFVAASGTVAYIDLEGGFYGIVADDGERYLPFGLDERYRADGMRITFVGKIARDTVTIQQWGTPLEILAVPWACSPCGGSIGIADPAAVWCVEQGYIYEIRKNPDGGEYGVCTFANGTEVDAWDYYRQNH